MSDFKHCDDYIDDPEAPDCLRKFLDHARAPAHGELLPGARPKLFAKYQGRKVRVVMASRFGDVGISGNLREPYGYSKRVSVADLTGFTDR